MDRREFLALGSMALAGLAGCTDTGDAPRNNSTRDGTVLYGGFEQTTIDPGSFVPYQFSLAGPATLTYTVTVVEGPNVDVIATSKEHLEAFEAGEDWQFYEPGSVADTAEASVEASLAAGDWALILDNSDEGKAVPTTEGDDGTPERVPVTVEFEYAVTAATPTPAQG